MPDEKIIPAPSPLPHPGPPLPLPPPHLLDISRIDGTPWTNPPYDTSDPNWSSKVVGGQTFNGSWASAYEWVSVLNPKEEQDDEVVLTGTAVNPGMASADLPFTHPFGGDFEFTIVPDSAYINLLATSNKDPNGRYKDDWSAAQSAGIAVPTGLLGVEIDGALVPADYRVVQGDRVAVYGRWIVDAGHSEFHSEIHPPLLMALARSVDSSGNVTPRSENATTLFRLWSRPYQAGQLFSTNGDSNLPLHDYCSKIADTPPWNDVKAFPPVFPQPFQGIQIVSFTIRPPVPAPVPTLLGTTWQLQASYHFTVRDSCSVEVTRSPADPNSLLVIVTLDSIGDPAPPKPPNPHFVTYSVQDLLNQAPSGVDLSWLEKLWLDWVTQVVYVNQYDAPQTSKTQDNVNVIPMTPIATLPKAGQATDNNQPFPVYGWVKLGWVNTGPTNR